MRKLLATGLLALWLVSCGGGGNGNGDGLCSLEEPCPEGYACNPDGECIEADPFKITTAELPRGAVDIDYQVTLEAEGGIPPHHDWTLETRLEWLSIDPETGTLSGVPDKTTYGTEVTARVTDSSLAPGTTVSRTYLLEVVPCLEEGAVGDCYEPQGEICMHGTAVCHDEDWGECTLDLPSEDAEHCGAGCQACEPGKADRCNGTCACGGNPPCTGDDICCGGVCIDPLTDPANCGGCGNDCDEQVVNVSAARCVEGTCDYAGCAAGYLDCNDNRSDGCETEMSTTRCGECDTNCEDILQNTEGITCEARGAGGFECYYEQCMESWGNCNGNQMDGCETDLSLPANCGFCGINCLTGGNNKACVFEEEVGYRCGCTDTATHCKGTPEQQCCGGRCYDMTDAEHCGDCTTDCTSSVLGPMCVDPASHTCGCFYRENCGGHVLCCNHVCTPVDDDHCGDCSIACDAFYGGNTCDIETEVCYCTSDAECQDLGAGATCVGQGTAASCQP